MVDKITVKKSRELHLSTCAICGAQWFNYNVFCQRCRERWGLNSPRAEWPVWARELSRYAQRRKYREGLMLSNVVQMEDLSWIADVRAERAVRRCEEEADTNNLPEIADWLLSCCTVRQREAIQLRILENYTWVAAGQEMGGICHAAVQRLVKRGIEKIREAMV